MGKNKEVFHGQEESKEESNKEESSKEVRS